MRRSKCLVRRGGIAAPSSSFYARPASSFSSSTDTQAINDDAINNRHSVTEEEEDEEEAGLIPMGESLSQCHDRIAAFFDETVAPPAQRQDRLVAAHSNVLRSLMTHLDEVDQRSPEGQIEVPKAVPIVYRLNRRSLRPPFRKRRLLLLLLLLFRRRRIPVLDAARGALLVPMHVGRVLNHFPRR